MFSGYFLLLLIVVSSILLLVAIITEKYFEKLLGETSEESSIGKGSKAFIAGAKRHIRRYDLGCKSRTNYRIGKNLCKCGLVHTGEDTICEECKDAKLRRECDRNNAFEPGDDGRSQHP